MDKVIGIDRFTTSEILIKEERYSCMFICIKPTIDRINEAENNEDKLQQYQEELYNGRGNAIRNFYRRNIKPIEKKSGV
jgi:hypothetical protein